MTNGSEMLYDIKAVAKKDSNDWSLKTESKQQRIVKKHSKKKLVLQQRVKETQTLLRVWSWLRMNAGGVPNTCKSSAWS